MSDTTQGKKRTALKIVLGTVLVLIVGIVGFSVYKSIQRTPRDVYVTNVTDSSATISWISNTESPGQVFFSEKESFLPGILNAFTKGIGYDDRDVQDMQSECVAEFNANLDGQTVDGNTFDCNDIKHVKKGFYYTHHVTITDLNPETTYYFRLSDGMFTWKNEDWNYLMTYDTPTEVKTPDPLFGDVKTEEGVNIDDDSIVYFVFQSVENAEESTMLSSVVNDEGGWYFDSSAIRNTEGEMITLESGQDTFEAMAVFKSGGVSDWQKWVYGGNGEKYPSIVINNPGETLSQNNPLSKFVFGAQAGSTCGKYVGNICLYQVEDETGTKFTDYTNVETNTNSSGSASGQYVDGCSSCTKDQTCALGKCIDKNSQNNASRYNCPGRSSYHIVNGKGRCYSANEWKCVKQGNTKWTGRECILKEGSVASTLDICTSDSECTGTEKCNFGKCMDVLTTDEYVKPSGCRSEESMTDFCRGDIEYRRKWSAECGPGNAWDATAICNGTFKELYSLFSDDYVDLMNTPLEGYDLIYRLVQSMNTISPDWNNPIENLEVEDVIKDRCECDYLASLEDVSVAKISGYSDTKDSLYPACTDRMLEECANTIRVVFNSEGEAIEYAGGGYAPLMDPIDDTGYYEEVDPVCPEGKYPVEVKGKVFCLKWTTASNECDNPGEHIGNFCYTDQAVCLREHDYEYCEKEGLIDGETFVGHEEFEIAYGDETVINDTCTKTGFESVLVGDTVMCLEKDSGNCFNGHTWDGYCVPETGEGQYAVNCELGGLTYSAEAHSCLTDKQVCNRQGNSKWVSGQCVTVYDNAEETDCKADPNSAWKGGICYATNSTCSGEACYCKTRTSGKKICYLGSTNKKVTYMPVTSSNPTTTFLDSVVLGAHAQEVETENELIYLPEIGMYNFQLDGEDIATEINSEATEYIFYVESNDEEGYQEDQDEIVSSEGINITYEKVADVTNLDISAGINIISLGGMPTDREKTNFTANDLFEEAYESNAEIDYIAKFEGGRWSEGYSCDEDTGECTGDDFDLLPGVGYLVMANIDGVLEIPTYGFTTPIPVSLASGWNLIGIHGYTQAFTARSFIDSVNQINGLTADNVTWWPTNKGKYEGIQVVDNQMYGLDYPIDSENGYFVRVSEFTPEEEECKTILWQYGGDLNGTCGVR